MREELTDISDAISLIHRFAEHCALISTATKEACKRLYLHLETSLETIKTRPIVGNPTLFLATPSDGPEDVIGEIKEILGREFSETISYYHWAEDTSPGNIHLKLWEQIRQAHYGIFYFSEVDHTEQSPYSYKDNVNVLYEAGMMQALQEHWDTTNIIIIREADSPELQFDLISERRMTVPRTKNQLNRESFRSNLIAKLNIINKDTSL